MTDFFNKTDLSRNDAEKIISETLNNCDDGELYLENSKSESIVLDDDKIKSSTYSSDLGYGLRAVTGEVVAYSHSNEIFKNNPDKEYVVFCGLGGQSTLATKTMQDMGLKNVKNITGGMTAWKEKK